jgi:leucyl/phenylalanyl-tRNA--protein transferase
MYENSYREVKPIVAIFLPNFWLKPQIVRHFYLQDKLVPTFLTDDETFFPPVSHANEHGVVAVGGDFRWQRILEAYRRGIFPWPHEGLPLLWFCPDPRFVLRPHEITISTSLRKALKKTDLQIVADRNFKAVMSGCQQAKRLEQSGTWISDEMIEGYTDLHHQGLAHSIEAYRGEKLVGGLYGASLGSIFFGESMFHLETNASKICLVTLAAQLTKWQFELIDCQAYTDHLASFGAHNISRRSFMAALKKCLAHSTRVGPWQLDETPADAVERLVAHPD